MAPRVTKKKAPAAPARRRKDTRCQARSRDEKGGEWIRCANRREVALIHTASKMASAHMEYCRECANRFNETFPKGTFRVEEL